MPLINLTRVTNNLVALAIILGIGIMIYAKMDKEQLRRTIEAIKGLFKRKEE